VLILTGPSGSGKNALIKSYCKKQGQKAIFHKDELLSYVEDLYTVRKYVGTSNQLYPEDLDNLVSFIRKA
jgi:hypothetical protein